MDLLAIFKEPRIIMQKSSFFFNFQFPHANLVAATALTIFVSRAALPSSRAADAFSVVPPATSPLSSSLSFSVSHLPFSFFLCCFLQVWLTWSRGGGRRWDEGWGLVSWLEKEDGRGKGQYGIAFRGFWLAVCVSQVRVDYQDQNFILEFYNLSYLF